jgi:hypothetical protein
MIGEGVIISNNHGFPNMMGRKIFEKSSNNYPPYNISV